MFVEAVLESSFGFSYALFVTTIALYHVGEMKNDTFSGFSSSVFVCIFNCIFFLVFVRYFPLSYF